MRLAGAAWQRLVSEIMTRLEAEIHLSSFQRAIGDACDVVMS